MHTPPLPTAAGHSLVTVVCASRRVGSNSLALSYSSQRRVEAIYVGAPVSHARVAAPSRAVGRDVTFFTCPGAIGLDSTHDGLAGAEFVTIH